MSDQERVGASFRDTSGFLYRQDGHLFRQINQVYAQNYQLLMESGLYDRLIKSNSLIPHEEIDVIPADPSQAFKVVQPEEIPWISYPYEWCFSQFRDAALSTLKIQKIALKHGMSLKDASAYNIQFFKGTAPLIDLLSFEVYEEGKPWVAYKQFCQHFLAPLALMSYVDVRLGQLSRNYIDGVPLDFAVRLLPIRSRFNLGLFMHLYLHAKAQQHYGDKVVQQDRAAKGMNLTSLRGLVSSLESCIKKLKWTAPKTEWGNYYEIANYSDTAIQNKVEMVSAWIDRVKPSLVYDLGANNGFFSRMASDRGINTVSFDIDPLAVEQNYLIARSNKEEHILPLVLDLTNPSPAIGWHNQERETIFQRGPADMVFALALVHHLAISNNVPLDKLADFFSDLGKWLIIEFVPKNDPQTKKLLANREDIFDQFDRESFERIFSSEFKIHQVERISDSERYIYLMETSAYD